MRKRAIGLGVCVGLPVLAGTAHASFHFMQIEQVIGGVDGDTTAQAIQLRMRSAGQSIVSAARVKAFDANGANPILIHDMTTNVGNSAAGSRVLIASQNFAHYSGGLVPNFTMTNPIPASYLSAGRITFEDDFGTIYWSLSFGGGSYTGSNVGSTTNDLDGNFGPPFSGALPSTTRQALQFTGAASALSTNNLAQYAITPGAATFINNANATGVVTSDQASTNYWDINGTNPGPGGLNPSGSWNGVAQNFNTNATGGAGTITAVTSALDTVVFAAGTDPLGPYTVAVGDTRSAAQVRVEDGAVTFTGGTLAVGTFDVISNALVHCNVIGGAGGSLTKTGGGALTITSNNTYTGGTNVQAGILEVNRLHQNNAVNITGGTLRVSHSAPAGPGTHPERGDDAFVSRPSSLTIAPGTTLDLTNNDLILDYSGPSPAADIEALVASGYNVVGDWAGDGITSSTAQFDGNFTLAVADNAALAAPFGTAQGGPLFSGVDVDLTTVLIKFTHRVDINLDGLVTPDDASIFGTNYDESITSGFTFAMGDVDFDGACTPNDAAIFGTFYDESLTSLPEPAGGVLGLCAAGVCVSRRRRVF